MAKKWIPNGDPEFVTMAENFARNVAKEPGRYFVAQAESDELTAAVKRFRAAFQVCRFGERSAAATRMKDDAREEAERIVRRLGHVIRATARIDAASKILLGLRERTAKAKQLPCPEEPPRVRFLRALHEGNGATPVHELDFRASTSRPPSRRGRCGWNCSWTSCRRRRRFPPTRGRTTGRGRGICGRTREARSS
jgi:hypothetical protein